MILDNVLKTQWSDRYEKNRQLFRSTLKYTHTRNIADSPFKAYFNLQLIENKAPTQIRDPETELIGEFDEEDANFLNLEPGEFLFRVDLVNGTIIEDENTVDENSDNPVILNTAPICSFHSLIVPFVNSKFQQLLSGFIAESVLNLFKLSSSQSLRIGYNSKLANCSMNHLHAHIIYVDQLFEEKRFPVEIFQIKNIVTARNQTLGEVKDYPIRTLTVSGENIIELLSLTIDTLLSHSIPHNIMFVNPQQAYIYPRRNQFDFIHEHGMRPAFIELSGLLICRNKQYYDELTVKEIQTKFEQLSHPEFDIVVEEIVSQFVD